MILCRPSKTVLTFCGDSLDLWLGCMMSVSRSSKVSKDNLAFVCVRQMRVGVTWRCVQRAESSFSSWPGGSQRTAVRP